MNAPLTAMHAEILGMRQDITETLNRMDDAESIYDFFGNWFRSIPETLLAASFGDDRIKASPQYRALGPKVRRVVDWALCPFDPLHKVKEWACIEDAEDAAIFFSNIVNRTTEIDDVHESVVNGYEEARGLIFSIEDDMHAEYRADQNRRLFGYLPSY